MWNVFFKTCLNVPSCQEQPKLSELRHIIMKAFFNSNHQKEFVTFVNSCSSLLKQERRC